MPFRSREKNGTRTVVSFPFSFEFRALKVEWKASFARIIGWGRRSDGSVDGGELRAEIEGHEVSYPRRHLSEKWINLWLQAYSDRDVERVLAWERPLVLFAPTLINFSLSGTQSRLADAWQMRNEFLRVTPNGEGFVAFLNSWGRWSHVEFVHLSELISLQSAVRQALLSAPEIWLQGDYMAPPMWERRPGYPYFGVSTNLVEVALRMTVTIDLLNQVKFRQCVRFDCGQPFAESRPGKKFCSRDCAHIEAVRRSRKKADDGLKDQEAVSIG